MIAKVATLTDHVASFNNFTVPNEQVTAIRVSVKDFLALIHDWLLLNLLLLLLCLSLDALARCHSLCMVWLSRNLIHNQILLVGSITPSWVWHASVLLLELWVELLDITHKVLLWSCVIRH